MYRHRGASTLPLIAGPFAGLYPLIMEDPGASGWVTSLQLQVQLCQGLLQLQIMQDSMSDSCQHQISSIACTAFVRICCNCGSYSICCQGYVWTQNASHRNIAMLNA